MSSAQNIPKARRTHANLIRCEPFLARKVVGVLAKHLKVIFGHSEWLTVLVVVGLAFIDHLGQGFQLTILTAAIDRVGLRKTSDWRVMQISMQTVVECSEASGY